MITPLLGIVGFVFFFVVHVWLWRAKMVARTPAMLVRIYLSVSAAMSGGFMIFQWLAGTPYQLGDRHGPLIEYFHSMLLSGSLFLAYLFSYPAIESDSPSNTILLRVASVANEGLEEEAVESTLSDEATTLDRLVCLVRDRKVEISQGKYCLTRNGAGFLKTFQWVRRIYTSRPFGG